MALQQIPTGMLQRKQRLSYVRMMHFLSRMPMCVMTSCCFVTSCKKGNPRRIEAVALFDSRSTAAADTTFKTFRASFQKVKEERREGYG